MKYAALLIITGVLCVCCLKSGAQSEAEKLDLPGDNFNLYAALKLFQESATLEGFEKALNDEKSTINNLDLNGDNKIDYIRVIDNPEGNVHNITLKIAVSKTEDQDVAVFVVNRESADKVQIQVIGDEDLYGKDYIIEPDFETGIDGAATPNPGYTGTEPASENDAVQTNTVISSWPVVRFIFVPGYVTWRSPWHWSYYPSYWRSWKPFYWHYYYGYHYQQTYYYNRHYRRWPTYRVPGWHQQYYGSAFRSQSVFVRTRYNRGDYKKTYSRPELANRGATVFRKDFPTAASAHNKLPVFDNSGRPLVTRPVIAKPAVTKPVVTEPVTERPVTKPVITRPIVTRPITDRPAITNPVPAKPVTKPDIGRPVITRPQTPKPFIKPVENRPVTRPVITKPVITRPVETRPVAKPFNRPAVTRPAAPRPVISRPAPQPVRPVAPRPARPVKE